MASEEETTTTTPRRKASEEEVKALVRAFYDEYGHAEGSDDDPEDWDAKEIADWDSDDMHEKLHEYIAENAPEDVNTQDFMDRADDAANTIQKNSERYVKDKNKAELEDRITGGNRADSVQYKPEAGVDYSEKSEEESPSEGDESDNPEDAEGAGENPGEETPDSDNHANSTPNNSTPNAAEQEKESEEQPKLDNAAIFKSVKDGSPDTQVGQFLAYGVMVADKSYPNFRTALAAHLSVLMSEEVAGVKPEPGKAESYLNTAETSTEGAENINGYLETNKAMYRSPSVSDASVGGNDAINPYSAFNLDDDIVHDVSYSGTDSWGMGRCYGEMYESKQQILYLTMGLPKYRNLQTWLENATDKDMSEMNDVGHTKGILSSLFKFVSGSISLAIKLPWLPFKWAANIVSSVKDTKITEYFYFRDNMPLYYRYWNTILSDIAVGMGLYGVDDETEPGGGDKSKPNNGANVSQAQVNKYLVNLPAIMQEGPDIFKIMSRRAKRAGVTSSVSTDDLTSDPSKSGDFQKINNEDDQKETTWKKTLKEGLSNFWTGIKAGALEGMNFVGFRIEKADNASESFSNSTQDSPLLSLLNGKVAEHRSATLGAQYQGEGLLSDLMKAGANITRTVNNVKEAVAGLKSGSLDQTIAYVASGNGFFDLPKQWSGSSGMSRSLSFNLKLRAKTGGDNVSIFQSIMIPLSGLLAAALPRAVGDTTYTSPFIVRAFCKGMFAVPAGIISTLSITRGSSEFGWSLSRLPTVVDVSFTIEDLSPMLFLSIVGGEGKLSSIFYQAFTNNSKMGEYINTLVGIGTKERYYLLGQLKRRLKTAMLISKNTVFSATYRGYVLGDSSIIRSLMALTPYTWVKNN